ncbi:MAG: hypothetical protein M0Z30_03090 [Actinomycetota bacterium]|nr:hypothetical protein [Actinomycetota bacterium]
MAGDRAGPMRGGVPLDMPDDEVRSRLRLPPGTPVHQGHRDKAIDLAIAELRKGHPPVAGTVQ